LAGRRFCAAVMVTASHNPPEYNGIKLFNPDGSSFTREQQAMLEKDIAETHNETANWDKMKNVERYLEAVEQHTEHILNAFPGEYHIKVALDCAGAAASVITPALLQRMGCEVTEINCTPGGFFPHSVEPTPENLVELASKVRDTGSDLGIAHDGDADRMMAVDNKGRFISGDKTMRLMAQELGVRSFVTTIDASMAAEQAGFSVIRTAVGDNNVCETLKNRGVDFGGEPSGAWIFPRSSYCPDGIFAAALMVSIAKKKQLAELVDNLPDYPIYRGSFSFDRTRFTRIEEELMSTFNPKSVSRIDGLKCIVEEGWFLVRPSGTEPKIRVTAEAFTHEELDFLKRQLVRIITKVHH